MVHRLEVGAGGKLRLVKCFSRSAAGSQVKTRPEELRPPSVCLKTADYLVNRLYKYSFYSDFAFVITLKTEIYFVDIKPSFQGEPILLNKVEVKFVLQISSPPPPHSGLF